MNVVTSGDCTAIVFDRIWDGAPLISSAAARPNRSVQAPPTELLASRFTVLNHARRSGVRAATPAVRWSLRSRPRCRHTRGEWIREGV